MASGYIPGQEINGQKAYLFWSYTQNVANRQTTITFTFKVKRTASGWTTFANNVNTYIEAPNGTDIYNADTFDYDITSVGVGSYITICSASKTFTHNTAGILADVSCDSGIDLGGTSVGEYLNATGTIEVAPIPVGSYLQDLQEYGNIDYFGGEMPIAIEDNGFNHTYHHTVSYVFGPYSGTIVTGLHYNEGTGWNIPIELANYIPNSKTGTVVLTCKTYNGTTLVGTTTLSQKLTVPSTMKPTLTDFWAGIADLHSADWDMWVKGKSQAILQWLGVGGVYGSTAKTWKITATGHSYSGNVQFGSESCYSTVLNVAGNLTFTLVITDSRGMTNSKTLVVPVTDYAPPVVSAFSALRATGGVADQDGTQILTHQVYIFTSLGGHNSLSIQSIKIKQLPSGAWGSAITVATGVDKLNAGPYSGDYGYQIQLILTDVYGTVTALAEVPITYSLMEWYGATGKGISFGKKAVKNGFDCDLMAYFNKGIEVKDRIVKYYGAVATDCNTVTDEWHLGGSTWGTNYPTTTYWYYVNTVIHGDVNQKRQMAYAYNTNRVYTRYCYNGTWSVWVRMVADEWEDFTLTSGVCSFAGVARVNRALKLATIQGVLTILTGQSILANTTTNVCQIADSTIYPEGICVPNLYRTPVTGVVIAAYIATSTGQFAIRSTVAQPAATTFYANATFMV